MKYQKQATYFSKARRCLMLPPPPGGVDDAIRCAFEECSLGLHDLDKDGLDDNAQDWVCKLEELMKMDKLEAGEVNELSCIVDELAHWFAIMK